MRSMLKLILGLHIVGGSVALLSMVIPLVTRKGGPTHRRTGWVVVSGMTIVSVTALVLSASRFLLDPRPGGRRGAIFLFYVAILTAAAVSAGVRVLRAKHRTGRHTHPWDLGIAALLTATSIGMAVFGMLTATPLFTGFSIIGLLSGGHRLAYWLRAPSHPMHWWFEHMTSMLGATIAATTAFLVVNADRLGSTTFSLIVWFAPTIIGVPVVVIWTAYYRRRFTSRRAQSGIARPAPAAVPYMPSRIA